MTRYALLPNDRAYWEEAGYVEEMNGVEQAVADQRMRDIPRFLTDRWLADNALFGPGCAPGWKPGAPPESHADSCLRRAGAIR